jgi:hypothetical protein
MDEKLDKNEDINKIVDELVKEEQSKGVLQVKGKIEEKKVDINNLRNVNVLKLDNLKDKEKTEPDQLGRDVSFLDKLDEKLYSRGRNNYDETRSKLQKPTKKPDFTWSSDVKKNGSIQYDIQYESIKKNFSFLALGAFVFSFVLMIGALSYAYWAINFAGNTVRQDKIELDLTMANYTEAGKSLTGEIKVANKNRSEFLDSYLSLDIVDNADGLSRNITQIELGNVSSGQLINKNVELNLVGKEGEEEQLNLTLYYKVPNSDSVFEKSISQKILITKSPLSLTILGPKSLSVEQEGEYSIKVRGVSENLQNVYLQLEPPKQMQIESPNFTAISPNIYDLGQIKAGEEKELKFKGVFKNVEEFTDKFTLKASVGDYADGELKNSYAEGSFGIVLENLPISVLVTSDNQSGDKIFFTSKEPTAKIQIKNESGSQLKNAELQIKLTGGLLNQKAVSVKDAQYDSSQGVVYANGETNENLKSIDIDGNVTFEINFKNLSSTSFISNKNITMEVLFKAENVSNTGLPSVKKFVSVLQPKQMAKLDAYALYFSGPLKNNGPIPPQVATSTTYTVIFSVETEGGFTKGKYTLHLPSNIKFLKTLDSSVNYNKETREVIWGVGTIEKPTNNLVQLNKKEASFQVELIPVIDDVKKSPILVDKTGFNAIDGSGQPFTAEASVVTTNISRDAKYEITKNMDIVVE